MVTAGAAAAEDLSRMEGEYGARMIGKLKQMDVLIVGLKGLGVETAKNLILAGPHSVTLYDQQPTVVEDLGANFYLKEEHVGIARGPALVHSLGELNPNVNVQLHTGDVIAAFLQQFDVVTVTTDDFPLSTLREWNAACRGRHRLNAETGVVEASPATFLLCSMLGCYGWLFADFGPSHVCFDDNGVPAKAIVVDHISRAEHGMVTIDGDRHLLNDGDLIKLEEVGGMSDDAMQLHHDEHYYAHSEVISSINATFEVKTTKNPKKFSIGDTRQLRDYTSGGVGLQVKKQITFQHAPLDTQLLQPTLIQGYFDFSQQHHTHRHLTHRQLSAPIAMTADLSTICVGTGVWMRAGKMGRDVQLHVARLALWEFHQQKHSLPRLHSTEDADALLSIARAIVAGNKANPTLGSVEVDETVIRQVSLYARAELTPLCALFGGVVAQEVTKQAGKYTPITQWFHFDAFELLSPSIPPNATPVGSRYDHQIAVFGADIQRRLGSQKTFLVGCGALGCEYLKAFALMGLGCGGGEVTVTDDDRIELSNLSRQFLFRRKHVGLAKSISAGEAAIAMNPQLKASLKTLETRVEPKVRRPLTTRAAATRLALALPSFSLSCLSCLSSSSSVCR
jgi:ubiquitin-activating enzyme E1